MKYQFLTFLFLLPLFPLQAGDWPQFRGANRDGKSTDTGLLKEWPSAGPNLLWKATDLGKGYSSAANVGERLYTMGDAQDASCIFGLDANSGKKLWTARVGKAGAPGWGGFAGPRCTPTVDQNFIYAVDQWGQLVCVRSSDGKEQWRKHYADDFGATRPEWGWSESPLVDGEQVVVTPGSPKGAIVALNKQNGATAWMSREFTDPAHYSSIIAAEINGTRQYVQLTAEHVVGINPKNGAVLWKAVRHGETAVVPTPIASGNQVYVSSGYGIGCNLLRVEGNSGSLSASQVYANHVMVNHHGGVVKAGDYLYGYSDSKGLTCQEFQSGKAVWAEKEKIQKGAVSFADGMLICREEDTGTVVLVEASPAGYHEKGRFTQPDRAKEKAWSHPTIANGKLYLRDQDVLLCYALK